MSTATVAQTRLPSNPAPKESSTATFLWAASSGQGFAAPKYGHGYFCVDDEGCYVADLNGDRRDDVASLKTNYQAPSQALVSLSNGGSFINPYPFTWRMSIRGYTVPAMLGDVNGDGKADLVIYENAGGNTTKYLVALTSDEPGSQTGTPPPPQDGVATVNLYNCVPEQRRQRRILPAVLLDHGSDQRPG